MLAPPRLWAGSDAAIPTKKEGTIAPGETLFVSRFRGAKTSIHHPHEGAEPGDAGECPTGMVRGNLLLRPTRSSDAGYSSSDTAAVGENETRRAGVPKPGHGPVAPRAPLCCLPGLMARNS